jgi:hypothetical protein
MDRMNADRLAAVITDLRRHLSTCVRGSRFLRKDGAAASITRLLPFSLSLRPGSDAVLADLAAASGMKPDGELPLMVLDATAEAGAIRRARGLTIRQLEPHEGPVHAKTAPPPSAPWKRCSWPVPTSCGSTGCAATLERRTDSQSPPPSP